MADVLKAAFVGFRHMHVFDIHARTREREDMEIVAVCEQDAQTRKRLTEQGIPVSHTSFQQMLSAVNFDFLVVGEVFVARGGLILAALEAGKHVLSDKPICTDLGELAQIKALSGRSGLTVAAALELRDSGAFLGTRELIRSGAIGTVRTVSFSGQHPLNLDSRPGWYFDSGKHGGTINDIAIHAVDILQWITGRGFSTVLAARSWNAGPVAIHHRFHNAAQLMLVMEDGCGVIGDVSYISPDRFYYSLPQYWRFNFWGDRGMIECGFNLPQVRLYRFDSDAVEELEAPPNRSGGYLDDLLKAIRAGDGCANASLFSATEVCLRAQAAADRDVSGIPLKD